jgi:GntR family transcriptional regulator
MAIADAPDFRPLYRQVRDAMARRIADGVWPPGGLIPSEMALADEFGVSQGTVRKALDWLTAENVLDRRQGRGTFVAEVTPESSLFRFFRMADRDGRRKSPQAGRARIRRRAAKARERKRLELAAGEEVLELRRVRQIDGVPAIVERIVVPAVRFEGLETGQPPNALYALYQRVYGISIISAEEQLQAVAAPADVAEALGVADGAPVLFISRVARALDGAPVEWRRSHCDTSAAVYAVTLR